MSSISSRSSTVFKDGSWLYSTHFISPSSDDVSVPAHSTALNSSTTYRPASIGNCLTPTNFGFRIVSPVSSRISRITASTNDSPGATCPPGSAQPCQSSFFRFCSSTLPPPSSRHTTVSSTFSVLCMLPSPSFLFLHTASSCHAVFIVAKKKQRRNRFFRSKIRGRCCLCALPAARKPCGPSP